MAVGGGSSGHRQAIGTLLTHGGKVQDWCGADKLLRPITPLIAIPPPPGRAAR